MPESYLINDFSAGWCPNDDPISGRKNGLLRMDSLELDQTGALRMSGGTETIYTLPVDAHTIYSKFLSTGQFRYVAGTDGTIYRNGVGVANAGSLTRTAFGAAFDYVLIASGNLRVKDDGTTVTLLGVTKPASAPTVALGAAGVLNGEYTYIQINVAANGSYVAKSSVGPTSLVINPVDQIVTVTPVTPGAGVNEVWIFRRGVGLDQYYRVLRKLTALGTAFSDNVSDLDALDEGVTLDLRALSVTFQELPGPVLEMVGPVNGRMIYFTKDTIHFSEVNSPDTYLPGQSIKIAGGVTGAELFLFARKVSESIILVGTTRDYYVLTGTFITQPDGTLDIYFRPLGVENPPISIDADTYNGHVVAMTAAGWKLTSPAGNQIPLTDDRVDRLYRGETLHGYGGVPIFLLPQLRYGCAVIRDKLYVRVPQIVANDRTQPFTYRMEAFDFKRKYWRPLPSLTPTIIYGQEDDALMGFYSAGYTLRFIDYQFTKSLNGVPQTIHIETLVLDNGKPRNRKTTYNIKFKIYTGGSTADLVIYTNDGATTAFTGTLSTSILTEYVIDILDEVGTTKNWKLRISGALSDFVLSDITIDYDLKPTQLSSIIIDPNIGPNKKRIRTWPFKMNNLGTQVVCTPYVDGVETDSSTFDGAIYEKTFFHYFKTDVFGVDYRFKLTSTALFELYDGINPEIVQVLPMAKRFDQLGPIELFRYGKLKEIEIRLIAFGGSEIPYSIYFEDATAHSGVITVVSGLERSYHLPLPKDVAGTILRIILGPTNFDFHRIYGRVKTLKSGKDTENEWVMVETNNQIS